MPDAGIRLFEELMRFKPDGLTANAWAVKAGVSRNIWNDLKRHGNPSRRTLEKLLSAADSSLAEFEALRADDAPGRGDVRPLRLGESAGGWRPAPARALPLVATVLAGEWGHAGSRVDCIQIDRGDVIDRVPRPASLAADRDAYAMTVVGDSMWPRFRPGRQLAVSPAAPVAPGDDVVVFLQGMATAPVEQALVKELVGRRAGWIELRQYHPDRLIKVRTADISAIHRIAGELI